MMPLPQLIAELMLGIGVALFGANLLVVIRAHLPSAKASRTSKGRSGSRKPNPGRATAPPSMTRVYLNMSIGAIVGLIGLAALIRQV
jgi:hypothetical protein